jgi:hypothetical protein
LNMKWPLTFQSQERPRVQIQPVVHRVGWLFDPDPICYTDWEK